MDNPKLEAGYKTHKNELAGILKPPAITSFKKHVRRGQ